MKKLFALFILFSVQTFAADLNLNGGESAIIQANVSTRVTCGGNQTGGSCSEMVQGFKLIMESCMRSYNGGYCAEKQWPSFKATNPSCAYAGLSICLEACQKSYNGGYCAEKCQ